MRVVLLAVCDALFFIGSTYMISGTLVPTIALHTHHSTVDVVKEDRHSIGV